MFDYYINIIIIGGTYLNVTYKQKLDKLVAAHGVSGAAKILKVNRKAIWRWRLPKSHPQHRGMAKKTKGKITYHSKRIPGVKITKYLIIEYKFYSKKQVERLKVGDNQFVGEKFVIILPDKTLKTIFLQLPRGQKWNQKEMNQQFMGIMFNELKTEMGMNKVSGWVKLHTIEHMYFRATIREKIK